MIVIRRGKGALVAVALVLSALVMNIVTNAMYDNEYYGANVWPKLGTFWLAGLMCFLLGTYLRKNPTPVQKGDSIDWQAPDHFFFIPVIYWTAVYFVVGIAYVAYKLSTGSGS